jgi:hypothetical protein
MIMQYEAPKNVYNTGFWLARPHPLVIEIFRDIHKSVVGEMYYDQTNGLDRKQRKVSAIKKYNVLFYRGLLEDAEPNRPIRSRFSALFGR